MTVTSLVAVVAPRTGKIIKKASVFFLIEEKICHKMIYFANRQKSLEHRLKTDFSEKGLALKGLS